MGEETENRRIGGWNGGWIGRDEFVPVRMPLHWLTQPAEQQIHLVMKPFVGVIPRLATVGTLTLMNPCFLHDSPPQSMSWNWG